MATVITPSGLVEHDVHGTKLDYYRGEGYTIREDGEQVAPEPFVTVGEQGPELPVPVWPGGNAKKADIAQYAVDAGLTELTVEELKAAHTQPELVELFGPAAD